MGARLAGDGTIAGKARSYRRPTNLEAPVGARLAGDGIIAGKARSYRVGAYPVGARLAPRGHLAGEALFLPEVGVLDTEFGWTERISRNACLALPLVVF